MKKSITLTLSMIAMALALFTTTPASARSFYPYIINHVEDFLDNPGYFNDYEHLDNIGLSGEWEYTVIASESGVHNWIHEGVGSAITFSNRDVSNFGVFRTINFDTTNLYFQDTGGPHNVAFNPYVNGNFFEVFQLTEDSEELGYLPTVEVAEIDPSNQADLVLSAGTLIVGFNDNGFAPRLGDADFDDLVVALRPLEGGSISTVPEPGTMLLLGCGLMGLAGVSRKRFQS